MHLQIVIAFTLLCLLIYKIMDKCQNAVKYYCLLIYFVMKVLITLFLNFPNLLSKKRHIRNREPIVPQLKPLLSFNGLKWQIQNKEYLGTKGGAVIITNHQTSLDMLVPLFISDVTNNIIGTSKLDGVWWTGIVAWTAYKCGYVFIDRYNPKKAYEALDKTIPIMKTQDAMLWIYPEGTRNKQNNTLLPFKRGAFVVAIKAQVPIITVVCSPHYFIDEDKKIFYNDGKIRIKVLPPVSTEGLTLNDVPELRERMREMMMETYKELAKEMMEELPENYPYTKEMTFN